MRLRKSSSIYLVLLAVLGISVISGCAAPAGADTTSPTVVSTVPIQDASTAGITTSVRATFSEEMEDTTIIAANFTVVGAGAVTGTVTYDLGSKTAIFSPTAALTAGTLYTATVTTGTKDLEGNALETAKVWTFTTAAAGIGPAPVLLGTAGSFVILAKTAISTVPTSVITGDVGLSPAAESFMTGFSQTDATGYATAPQVTGFLYAADMTPPTPTRMTTAVSDMETAYTDAAGRVTPNHTDLGGGEIGGLTLAPGLYKWASSVTASTDVMISGGANDIWIFQMTGDLTVATSVQVTLAGGAQAKNIFWQVAGSVSLEATSHFEGIILCLTNVALNTSASMNGRALAQTAVTLNKNTVTQPVE